MRKYKIVTLELKLKLDAGHVNDWVDCLSPEREIWREEDIINFVRRRLQDALCEFESERYPVTETEGVESIRVMDSRSVP